MLDVLIEAIEANANVAAAVQQYASNDLLTLLTCSITPIAFTAPP
jgi:hypothetical protein